MLESAEVLGACDRIAEFVRRALEESGRSGIAVAMSGGLDSTVTAALCVRGVGAERVKGFFLPEREGPAEDRTDAELAARWLGVRLDTHDMTKALDALGVYDFVLSKVPGEFLRAAVVRAAYGLRRLVSREDPLEGGQRGSRSAVVSRSAAHFKARHRMRMVFLYFRAERENLLVAGAANRTEKLTGIYTRFGVDDCADIMPVAGLYRTEVLRAAEALGVPERIRGKTPAPGIIPGVRDKYVYLLDLESGVLDRVLEELVAGGETAAVAGRLGLPQARVERVAAAMRAAQELRGLPREAGPHGRNPRPESRP
ncbi:MAG: NAD(+) synthase [Candidatus Eisenbacteria bacterium]|nr:NAD(+) synthase [Candidatus Eisenbacteria bacterium]